MTGKRALTSCLLAAGLCGGLQIAAVASAGEAPASPAPAAIDTTPTQSMRLEIERAHGRPPFALLGERIVVRGVITPYAPGQKVVLHIYRDGHRVLSKRLGVGIGRNSGGWFRFTYRSSRTGLVSVRGEHLATPQLGALVAKTVSVRYEPASIGVGKRGSVVRWLQDELARLRYAVPVSGYFDQATAHAVVAFRKVVGRERVESANAQVFGLLGRGAGRFHVRYPRDGKHVEADLSKQVLVEVERGGRVRRIYTMSSGKPSTPTVLGRFRVYSKTPGTNSKGMVDSNYFIRGYAIHGYAEVPTYAASHGCLRIPIPDAPAVFGWVQVGDPVDVYTDNGRGSRVVRGDAGP